MSMISSIVRGFRHNRTVTLVLTAPPYIFAAIGSLVNAWHSDKTKVQYLVWYDSKIKVIDLIATPQQSRS